MKFTSSNIPVSLYVHIPWCVRKCPYCDFNSHEAAGDVPEREYVDLLLRDLDMDLEKLAGRSPVSVFIGGGTPSLLSPEAIERLILGIRAKTGLGGMAEITMEANPGTVERERFAEFRAAGVNRLSIGIQSFQDEYLQKLGRIHGAREAVRAAEAAHDAGFHSFNLDLMFGLPGQNLADAGRDLQNAIALEPAHISWYQLTLEPNTLFYHHPPAIPEDDLVWLMQQRGQELLSQAEYLQYEVSAYAKDGKQCLHNLNYWEFGDYLGIGAGAHGKYTEFETARILRTRKKRNPRDYRESMVREHDREALEAIAPDEIVLEFMMNALRLTQGFSLDIFEQRTGLHADMLMPVLLSCEERELLQIRGRRVQPTQLGQRFLNNLLEQFMEVKHE